MFRHTTALLLTIALGFVPAANSSTAPENAVEAAGVYRETLPGVAWVVTTKPTAGSRDQNCQATAWVADIKERLLVTNAHVTDRATSIRVYFPSADSTGRMANDRTWYEAGGSGLEAQVIASDARKDLSVIQVPKLPVGTRELRLAGQRVSRGVSVFTVGNPGSSQAMWECAAGTVKQAYPLTMRDGSFAGSVIECSVASAPGASGSPVVNAAGEVVSVVFATTRNARPVTLCIDAAEVRIVLESARLATSNPLAVNTAR